MDKIIVIDLESTCWDKKTPERLQESEVIEIGVCVIESSQLRVESSEAIFVLPQHSTVSEFCTELTNITQEMLDENGIPFSEACALLRRKYSTNNKLWASWGDYDRRQFERQCKRSGARYPFGPTHLNVKNLFAVELGLFREVGMEEALKRLGMELKGTYHRGCRRCTKYRPNPLRAVKSRPRKNGG